MDVTGGEKLKMKIVAFVPVKGSSVRVPNKNTRIFNGEPFFLFTVRKLLKCAFIDEVYVDSENDEILELAVRIGAKPLPRDPALASNKTDGNVLFFNEVRQIEADLYIQHLCTSPFLKEETILQAVSILNNHSEYDSVVLGAKEKRYHWDNKQPLYDLNKIPNSVDLPDDISEAMALYVVRRDAAYHTRRRIGDSPCMIFGDPTELIDVNTVEDLALAKVVGAGLLAEEEKRLRVIGRLLTSPILSDIADELGLRCVLAPEYNPNIMGAKIFGRARTLHIREAIEGDPPDSIYEALKSYAQVVSNDVIVVRNERPDLAYFGDLNMSLAIRSGAVGAIIGGVTRDTRTTANSGFPVYAKGRYCRDIKGSGAVQSINQLIELDGVTICPSDLVFADEDGVVVIPRKEEARFLRLALEKISSEKSILADVCKDVKVESLINKYGFF
jgi:CMP-N-acetylneuraminic acid synthetase/regulator of RNase E activity RraA